MSWAVISDVAGSGAQGASSHLDHVVFNPIWEDDAGWNTSLGSPFAPLHQPLPAARGMLDDETSGTTAHGYLASAPFATGGRRNWDDWLKRRYEAVLHIDYQQKTSWPPLWENQLKPPVAAKGNQTELPVLMRQERRKAQFWATTTQEGLRFMHPSLMPIRYYGDNVCRLLSEVQRHLLEPVIDGGFTWQLWTAEEVQQAFLLRMNRFLLETGIIRSETSVGASSGTGPVPDDVLDVTRAQWKYRDGRKTPRALTRIDTRQADTGFPDWEETPGEPISYVEEPQPNGRVLQLYPVPDANGDLGLRYIPYGSVSFETCGKLPIPRCFTWILKWGLIADLLKKEGEANDPVRAGAAEVIYKRGVDLVKALMGP